MACTTKFFLFIVLFYLVIMMQEASECNNGYGCFYAMAFPQQIPNRKVLYVSQGREAVFKSGVDGATMEGDLVGWELRNVPSGPDPLHHNGGSTKKPQNP